MAGHELLEIEVESKVCALAERAGWLVRKVKWIGRRGAPDRMFVRRGRIVLIEFKRPKKGQLHALQDREIARLRRAGAECYVVNSVHFGKIALGLK